MRPMFGEGDLMKIYKKARDASHIKKKGINLQLRRIWRSREVSLAIDNLAQLERAQTVLVCLIRNEAVRVPFLLQYYRQMGFDHFIFIDNGSTDGFRLLLENLDYVTVFDARGSYRRSRHGMDWVNAILHRYCIGKWCLNVDTDELLVFPFCESLTINDLTSYLDSEKIPSLRCLLLDMYSSNKLIDNTYLPGQNPLEVCNLFDAEGYEHEFDPIFQTNWIKGGVRGRLFFPDVRQGPALNKTPLVKWRSNYSYMQSTHQICPPAATPASHDPRVPTGTLLHFKFLSLFKEKVAEEATRGEHTVEYHAYTGFADDPDAEIPTCSHTRVYKNSLSLQTANLLQPGGLKAGSRQETDCRVGTPITDIVRRSSR